jgi:hypothetical protein
MRMLNLGAEQTPPLVNRVPHIPMLRENNVRKGFFEHDREQGIVRIERVSQKMTKPGLYDADLKLAAEKHQEYLNSREGTISGTVVKIERKKG